MITLMNLSECFNSTGKKILTTNPNDQDVEMIDEIGKKFDSELSR